MTQRDRLAAVLRDTFLDLPMRSVLTDLADALIARGVRVVDDIGEPVIWPMHCAADCGCAGFFLAHACRMDPDCSRCRALPAGWG